MDGKLPVSMLAPIESRIGDLDRLNEIAPAQLGLIEAHLARGLVHQPFEQIVDLRPARTAIGTDRHLVREHPAGPHRHLRDVVDRGHAARDVHRAAVERHPRQVGAEIADDVETHRLDLAAASNASSASNTMSRACVSLMKASARVENQCTGRPVLRAASSTATYSG